MIFVCLFHWTSTSCKSGYTWPILLRLGLKWSGRWLLTKYRWQTWKKWVWNFRVSVRTTCVLDLHGHIDIHIIFRISGRWSHDWLHFLWTSFFLKLFVWSTLAIFVDSNHWLYVWVPIKVSRLHRYFVQFYIWSCCRFEAVFPLFQHF